MSFSLNPDKLNPEHGLSPAELSLAKKLEQIADIRQKEILEKMGVKGITRDMLLVKARNLAQKQQGIVIKHVFDDAHPDGGGWQFWKGDSLKLHLGHPTISKSGRIEMHVQEFLDGITT